MGNPLGDADTQLTSAPSEGGVALVPPIADAATRFEKAALLGKGGMGEVWQYRDRRIGRRVAMKVLHPALAKAPQVQARFLREAQIQGQLEHPAVVPVYDLGATPDGQQCIAMKQVRGATLGEIIAELRAGQARFTRRRLLSDFARVCLAIDFAHARGVLHRDLKPANIMLGDFGEVYVLDWGLAKLHGDAELDPAGSGIQLSAADVTQDGALMGTPGYMSPEQIRGEVASLGPASDIYALGAILFELLALERLHAAADALSSTLGEIDTRPSSRAPDADVPPELDAICVRALAADPDDRFPSARAMSEAIDHYLDGERDLELRREQAAKHAAAAREAAQRPELDARRTAMREIGRALALDPDHAPAVETMVTLLTNPPDEMPLEVGVEIDRQDRFKHRWVGKVGAAVYASIFGFLPVCLWVGIRQPAIVVGFFGVLALACISSAMVGRSRAPSYGLISIVLVLSNIAFAIGAGFFGPLVLMPGVIAVNATAFAVFSRKSYRLFAAICASLAVVVPFALELTGVITPSYHFDGNGMYVIPRALALPQTETYVLLVLASLSGIILGCFVVGNIRDSLGDAERRLLLYAWHLRELVPTHARDATEPVNRGSRGAGRRASEASSASDTPR